MNILITGATGLIGSATSSALAATGHRVVPLRRTRAGAAPTPPFWNPEEGQIDLGSAEPFDAVIHLAGESIAQRWTPAAQARIRSSRTQGTRLLSEALARLPSPPRVMLCGSATGFYGDRGEELLDETSSPGTGFLAEVCREWEAASEPLQSHGVRVVHLRTGIVLDTQGGALARMLPAFRLGLGGRLGSGRQFWSWIALTDLVRAMAHLLAADSLAGPINAVSPHPATNCEFTKELGRALRRPTPFVIPAFAVNLLFGKMGREAMLASARVVPRRLMESGFAYQSPTLDVALRQILARRQVAGAPHQATDS
jgi:uncharacterized protein (TIGR01777 family)